MEIWEILALKDGSDSLLGWCGNVLGDWQVVDDQSKEHMGHDSGVHRLASDRGPCFLKIHEDRAHWAAEVHGYERWAPVFGAKAPRLLGVHDSEPLALIVTALPGTVLERVTLRPEVEKAVWFDAGRALADLHALPPGSTFGVPGRDGRCAPDAPLDAVTWVSDDLDQWVATGRQHGCLTRDELWLVDAARELLPAFAGERPIPCHRDYCPANWMVDDAGRWTGVIDFEFSRWDVRISDLTRYPDWDYVERPEMVEAWMEGYGRTLSDQEERQRLVAHVQYALAAIVWGHQANFLGFKAEGQRAMAHLASRFR